MTGASANSQYLVEQENEEGDAVTEISLPHCQEQDQANLSPVSPTANIFVNDSHEYDYIATRTNKLPVNSQGDGGANFAYTSCAAYGHVSNLTHGEEGLYDN